MLHSARPLFWPLLAAACALSLSWASPSAHAAKLYKCTTHGEVTYSNEPCRGQSMQVVQPNDGNMVTINSPREQARAELAGEAPELPTIKLPASGAQDLPPSFTAQDIGQAAAPMPADGGQNAAEGFLRRLQAETQALQQNLTQQQQSQSAAPAAEQQADDAAWAAALGQAANPAVISQMQEMMADLALAALPNAQDLATEGERVLREAWWPKLRRLMLYSALALIGFGLVFLLCIYWIVRLALRHGLAAAQRRQQAKRSSGSGFEISRYQADGKTEPVAL